MTQKSRRDFIRASSLLVAGGAMPGGLGIARSAHAFGGDLIRVGLIGCGGCGREAAARMLDTSSGPVRLVAMADVFGDRIQAAFRMLKSRHRDKVDVPHERRLIGLDAYRPLLALDLDLVILATPPGFRPLHFEAAVAAGKHVFLERPVAVDVPGVRRVLETGAVALQKNLAVAVGLQHRHEQRYRETIGQLQAGLIGDPVTLRVYRNAGSLRGRPRQPSQTELEYQLRNWPFFAWLSGDQIVERHVQNLDVGNWLMGAVPVSVNGQGALAKRRASCEELGETYDQFFCEYAYPDGTRMFSQCRHLPNCWNNVSEHVQATRGRADISGGKIYDRSGERIWQTKSARSGRQQQHRDLIEGLRGGYIPNEAEYGAQSTLTAIMGRMAAYSGQLVTCEEATSSAASLATVDDLMSLEDTAPVLPDADGCYPRPEPGLATV